MSQQRILIITRNLPPLVGGMERLNWHMADELSKYAEVKVIGPQGSADLKPQSVSLSEAPLKPLPLFLFIAACKAVWFALRWKPDVILAGSGLTAPIAWLASKLCGAKSAAYLHGFDITVQDKIYQRLWTPTFKKLDRIIVNSTPTKQLAFAAGVPETKISIVYPGVSLPEHAQPDAAIAVFRQQHGLEGKKIMLSVGRLTTRKGLKEFVEQALPAIVQQVPEAVLVIVGEAPKNSLGAGIQSRESIEQIAKKVGVSEHLLFLGGIDEQALMIAYKAALLHVFPVRYILGDPEGFGMVAIEAAAHGLPTLAFSNGGVVDAVSNNRSGLLIEKEDYTKMANFGVVMLKEGKQRWELGATAFAQEFAWSKFGEKVVLALKSVEQTEL